MNENISILQEMATDTLGFVTGRRHELCVRSEIGLLYAKEEYE